MPITVKQGSTADAKQTNRGCNKGPLPIAYFTFDYTIRLIERAHKLKEKKPFPPPWASRASFSLANTWRVEIVFCIKWNAFNSKIWIYFPWASDRWESAAKRTSEATSAEQVNKWADEWTAQCSARRFHDHSSQCAATWPINQLLYFFSMRLLYEAFSSGFSLL